ncbi:MAG: putative toxin-antitoxin system toxin component, PIN family [Prevotella sp.]|jgi:putative PIN family toxin of toxin-antitoxin system|nr:putative toxin-antitoxin system toxin component, PIN family [Prevotella sp.]MBR2776208.1 putative toxin-antitoxin system toxin component, PIN family [Prevotella sp.]
MIHAVIDTNVLVSAFITKNLDSSTAKVWSAVLNGDITPMYNEEIIEEYTDVLHRMKFNVPEQLIKDAINHIIVNGVRGERVLSDDFFTDPKDVVFFEVALSKDDAYLVTGNTKHFPKKPIVVTPAEMLEILRAEI